MEWLRTVGRGTKFFIETKGSDLLVLALSLIGTYFIAQKIVQIAGPHPEIDEESKNNAEKLLKERTNKKIKLTPMEASFASNIIMPHMISISFDDIGGLEETKEEIEQMIVMPFLKPELFTNPLLGIPKGILLYGPPGTGKTMLAKAIAKQSKAVFINFSHEKVFQAYVGESEKMMNAMFSTAVKFQPSVLFLDEADSFLCNRGSSQDNAVMLRLQCMLLEFIDGINSQGDQVMVLACTNRPDALDPAFLRRMQRKIAVGLPNKNERARILRLKLPPQFAEADFDYDELASVTEYYSGSDLELLCRTAAQECLRDSLANKLPPRKITREDCQRALRVSLPTTRPNPAQTTFNEAIQKVIRDKIDLNQILNSVDLDQFL